MRLLIVDHEASFREELEGLLTEAGHSVTAADSVSVALAALDQDEFDVLFTDIRLGRRSGMDLLTEARNRWPRMPVVMLTGKATVENAVKALREGAFDYLRKPIQPNQVRRVLELVGQQLALVRSGARPLDPLQYANALAAEGGYEVLLISPAPVKVTHEMVQFIPLDPKDPVRIREDVRDFVEPRTRAAVVLAAVEQLLAHHREEEIAELLDRIRSLLEGKGPLAVGYDPKKITATGALAVRASIVSAEAGVTLDSLANPIRRLVLRRLSDGPCSFTQAMEAAHLDDTSLIAFHLRKLTDSGLISHLARKRYELTPRGLGAVKILHSIDSLDSERGTGNRIFPSKVRKRARSE